MNFLDIILLIPLAWGAYHGYRKGFVIELTSLAALVLGIFAAINFSYYIADLLTDNVNLADKYINIIAFILTFIIVVFALFLIGKLIEKFVNILMLGFINRLAGLFFGIIKWAFVLSVLIYIIHIFDDNQNVLTPKLRNGSALYEPIESFAPYIIPKLNIEKLDEFTRPLQEDLDNV